MHDSFLWVALGVISVDLTVIWLSINRVARALEKSNELKK